jgi:hypothetical protein
MPTVREASALLRTPPSGGKADGSNPGRVHGPDVESRGGGGQQKDDASGRASVLKERLREPTLQLPAGDDGSDAGLRVYCEDGSGKRTYATLRVRPRARFAAAPAACLSTPVLGRGEHKLGPDLQKHGQEPHADRWH